MNIIGLSSLLHEPFKRPRYPDWDHPRRQGLATFTDQQLKELNDKWGPNVQDFLKQRQQALKKKASITRISSRQP